MWPCSGWRSRRWCSSRARALWGSPRCYGCWRGGTGKRVIDLDDPGVRAAAADDPGLFATGPAPVFIDEYQHVPEVLDSIKAELNRDGSPGRFVLAGSTRFEALPLAAQSLTGRLHRLDILPLSQGEIRSHRENLLEAMFNDPAALVDSTPSGTTREEYIRCITAGGFPLALGRSEAARDRWFDDYSALCLERDLLEAGRVRRLAALASLLSRLAAQTAQVLNMSHAARAAGLPVSTATDYVRLLETSFLVRMLPAWGRTPARFHSGARPKVHMVDSGLAARLLRLPPGKLTGIDPAALQQFGHLLETFTAGEILKQASWMRHRSHIGHWRSHDGFEVDIVAENGR